MVINLWNQQNEENFVTTLANSSFSRRSLVHGVSNSVYLFTDFI